MTTTKHLSTEQLYELLDTPAPSTGTQTGIRTGAQTSTHLEICLQCQQELATMRQSLGNFRTAATNYAAAEMPALAPPAWGRTHAARTAPQRQVWAASFATVAVLMAVSVSLIHPRHQVPSPATGPTSVQTETATNESDEALLDGIQRDLSTSVPPSLAPLEVGAATNPNHK